MNTKKITMKAVTMIAAGSVFLLINVPAALGQAAGSGAGVISYTSENFRDPFESYVKRSVPQPLGGGQEQTEEELPLPALTVSGITWGSSYGQAIVNGKVVKAGDEIEGVRIISISRDGLVVSFNNRQVLVPAPKAGGVQK